MIGLPWDFLLVGVALVLPETLWWAFVSRPRERRVRQQQERTQLFWSIRNREMDLYGRWLS